MRPTPSSWPALRIGGATIVNDGELVIFVPVNGNMNRVRDTKVTTEMLLSNWNSSVVYIQDGDVWKVRMT